MHAQVTLHAHIGLRKRIEFHAKPEVEYLFSRLNSSRQELKLIYN